ncbi:MAG TPA: DUF4440 domain-containing protein, partial [Thermoanaerobaculia bacterium]|nr:DUF4440 domain-containing protein [Thermoanaerobaculia bacterium]
ARNFPMASNLQIQSTDFEASGDLAYDFGEYSQRITPPKGKPVEERGRYLVVLRRDDAGGWKIEKHLAFPLNPPPATTAARR